MRNGKNKIISLVLVIVLIASLFSFTSCNRKFDKEEVVEAAKRLLQESEKLNYIYYGSGIRYIENEEYKNGSYYRADREHLAELGISSVAELKILTQKTFSVGYCNNIYSTLLSSLKENGQLVSVARYYQHTNEETGETYMMVYSRFDVMFKDSISYDYESITAKKSKKENVYVSVNATVTDSNGRSQQITLTVNLIEEADGWKISSPTYANYNELKDRYDELKNQELK